MEICNCPLFGVNFPFVVGRSSLPVVMRSPSAKHLGCFRSIVLYSAIVAANWKAMYRNPRIDYRHPVRWRIGLVYKNGDGNDIYHGRTNDLSMTAVSILTDQNICMMPEVVILLAPAPAHSGQKKIIIEIVGELVYTVLDEKYGMFRISIRFRHFKGDGKKLLASILSRIPRPKPPPAHYGLV